MGLLNKIFGNYSNNASDPVCFQSITGGKISAEQRTACYAGHVSVTQNRGIISKDPEKSRLTEEHYYEWMGLCKQNGLVINDAICFHEDNRNQIYIAEGSYHYALVYTSLCCFRWSTHYTKMVYDIISDKSDISFHQKLHYQLASVISNWNHSFTYLAPSRNAYSYAGRSDQIDNLDLRSSLSWKIFFNDFNDKERESHFSAISYNHLNEAISHLGKSLPKMVVKDLKDVLSPRWTPLYNLPWSNKKFIPKSSRNVRKPCYNSDKENQNGKENDR